jgi:hypothetical protein
VACLLAPVHSFGEWPFASPARPAGTPFTGFSDTTGPGQPSQLGQTTQPGGADEASDRDVPLVEKPLDQLSNQTYDELGQKALAIRPDDWRHAETDNFILHYRRVTEAKKVAREVEYDISYVATMMGAKKEQYEKKSHVFIFQDDKEWQIFLSQTKVPSWAASFAHGDNLFLNLRSSGTPFDSRILAHETTHAVVARLFPGSHWPLWLNEGFAEYMGAASVAARKNQTIRRHEHTLNFAGMSLDQLQQLQVYPQDPVQVAQLYETAEKLVRFIMTELPKDRFTQFVDAVVGGQNLQQALHEVYPDKLASYSDFEKKYARFSK